MALINTVMMQSIFYMNCQMWQTDPKVGIVIVVSTLGAKNSFKELNMFCVHAFKESLNLCNETNKYMCIKYVYLYKIYLISYC